MDVEVDETRSEPEAVRVDRPARERRRGRPLLPGRDHTVLDEQPPQRDGTVRLGVEQVGVGEDELPHEDPIGRAARDL